MSLIKNPSELQTKKTISMLIYGEPGIGKTTLGCSAPNPVLFDFDGGVMRINPSHRVPTVQINSWAETNEALNEIMNDHSIKCDSIVIDTAGKMLDYMSAYIIANDPRMAQKDGSLSLKGYGVRKNMFIEFNKRVMLMGKNIIYIAHTREEKRGEDTIQRPEIGGSSVNDLIKELDLVGFVHAIGKVRCINFDPEESHYGKNTCNLHGTTQEGKPCSDIGIANIVDENGNTTGYNNFLQGIIKTFQDTQEKSVELTKRYEVIMADGKNEIALVDSLEKANALRKKIADSEPVFGSILQLQRALYVRCTELGFKYNKELNSYVAA